ncbi:MAG: DNA helicase RecQ [Acidimicrobiales bacterium]|nr:DNA helicase RecQ [Hyphomonadaceae bacterium]RZV41587.1 MAG: DNA helicase RecQ [Acidimicrobiales bacterium]
MTTPASTLKSTFGFDAFRPGQDEVISEIMAGRNVLAVMPTGAGKSLCYQVPALLFDRVSVVVSPLVALMDNQVAALRANGIDVACIHSGQSREVNITEWQRVSSGNAKLLYLSPERLMTPRMKAAMKSLSPSMFVVDEAHCVSKWGPAFRPEYAQLSELKSEFPDAVIAAFTATADGATREDIARALFNGRGKTIVQGFDRPNLSLAINVKSDRKVQLTKFMENVRGQSGIVYALSRKNTETYAAHLVAAGHKALPYHAGLDAQLRFDTQERFMAEDGIVIVATIAFGMGIDKPDIRFVYHTNLPGSLEAYYQEIGRAGRDGAPAATALCYGLDDVRMRRQFIMQDGSGSDHQIRELRRLDALLSYCEASTCRRQVMLAYFGEKAAPCGNCDNCENPPVMIDATEPLKYVLTTIEDTGARFGQAHIIAVARGADTERIRQFSHQNTNGYGQAKAFGSPYLQGLIRQALASGHIDMDIERFGALTITDKGRAVLKGQKTYECKAIVTTKASKRSASKRVKTAAQNALSEDDQELLSRLKAKRMEIARGLGKPAYVVFSDATLIDMVQKRPESPDAMLDVSGVGAVKYGRFGPAFLEMIREATSGAN